MARKRYSDEDALKLLREIDVHQLSLAVVSFMRCPRPAQGRCCQIYLFPGPDDRRHLSAQDAM